ncbi:MAG: hypothetical protein ACP5H2_10150 [Solirubrobacteraceae bacterium]
MTLTAKRLLRGLVSVGLAAAAFGVLPATVLASPEAVPVPPNIPGAPKLPGPVAPAFTTPASVGSLLLKPDTGVAGTKVTVSYKGLPANTNVSLVWSTYVNTWVVDGEPGTANYMGRSSTPEDVVLASATTDSSGTLSTQITIPRDWGGVHDIYAVINDSEVASAEFTVYRTVTVSPKSGPVGTPITITYSGIGASFYEGGGMVLWDNHYAGEIVSNWTRGWGRVVIRAAGSVGTHYIEVGDAISFLYMNIQQSPLPWANGSTVSFRITKGNGKLPKTQVDMPRKIQATDSQITTLGTNGFSIVAAPGVTATVSKQYTTAHAPETVTATGLAPNSSVSLVWQTVTGSRVNCTNPSGCWTNTPQTVGTATTNASGDVSSTFTTPDGIPVNGVVAVNNDGLGGWHELDVEQNGQVMAHIAVNVRVSLVGKGVSSQTVKEGHKFTIDLIGLGWTQFDNTLAVDYDNSYVGYGCGFNSDGYTVITLRATGGPGIHLIDLYPMLYSATPSFANTPYGMVPFLNYATDFPSLALGYKPEAIRLAIRVVK